jgi:hypothetical protein
VRFPFFFLQFYEKCHCHGTKKSAVETTLFDSHSPALAWTFYYDQTESQGGKKHSVLMICIDEIPNLHQIGELCTVHSAQKNTYDFHEINI